MAAEYELSVELVFWGDALDSKCLAHDLQLTVGHTKTKGEPSKLSDGTDSGSVAKTGMLSCEVGPQGSSLRRDPEGQLLVVVGALKRLSGPLGKTYGAANAELQINIYYRDQIRGEPDFIFPQELLEMLVQHRIELRVTVLP